MIPEGTYYMKEWKKSKEVLSMRMTLKQMLNEHNSKVSWGRAETGSMGTIHFYSSQPPKNTIFQLYLQIVEIILLSSS